MFSAFRVRAFSLLELVVVVVVLAVLAAIAVPTFSRVIERSQDEAAVVSLSSYAREVQALAAFRLAGFEQDDFFVALEDFSGLSAAPGFFAARPELRGGVFPNGRVHARSASAEASEVLSYSFRADGSEAALAGVSASGACVAVRFTSTQVFEHTLPDELVKCTAYNVLAGAVEEGVAPEDDEAAPENQRPAAPASFIGSGTGGFAELAWSEVPGTSSYQVFRTGSASPIFEGVDFVFSAPQEYGSSAEYSVVALNKKGASEPRTVLVHHVPAAPVISSVVMDNDEAVVSWKGVSGALGYNLYRDGADTIAASSGPDTFSLRVPLEKGQTAVFVLVARNLGGLSEGSAPVGVTASPDVPQNVVAQLQGDTVELSWSPVSGATSYDVFYSDGRFIRLVPSGTSVGVPIAEGESAAFVVRAKNAAEGASPASAPSNVVTRAPGGVAGLVGSYSSGAAVLIWSAVPGATEYLVYRDGGGAPVASVPGPRADVPLEYNTTASFSVAARNDGGVSSRSNSVSVTAVTAPPADVSASAADGSALVSWSQVSGADRYEVFYADTDVSAGIVIAPSTSLSVSLPAGESASFYVRSGSPAGWSPKSVVASVTAVPSAPQNLSYTRSGSVVNVSWDAVPGASGYEVFRSGVSGAVSSPSAPSAAVALSPGESASITVRAVNAGGVGAFSAPLAVVVAPAAPADVSARFDGDQVTVSWASSPGADGYYVYYVGSATIQATLVGNASTSATFTVPPGSSRSFEVRAYNSAGTSAASGAASSAPLSTPSNVSAAVSELTATVSWSPVPNASSYQVFKNSASSPFDVVSGTSASAVLAEGESASFRVKAVNAGGVGAFSASSNSVTARPGAISGFTITPSSTDESAVLSWAATPSATSYSVRWVEGGQVRTSNVPSFTTGFHVPGTVYSYNVQAVNGAGSGPVSATLSTEASYSGVVLADAPNVLFRFNESTGTVLNAAQGVVPGAGAYTGTFYYTGANAPFSTAGTAGTAGATFGQASPLSRDAAARSVYFGGGSYATGGVYVDLPNTGTSLTTNGYTLEAWVKAADLANWARMWEFGNGRDSNGLWLSRQGTTSSASIGGRFGAAGEAGYRPFDTPGNGNKGVEVGVWHHLVGTYDPSGTARFYVDGVEVGVSTDFAYKNVSRTYNFIARSSYSHDEYFKGNLAELAYYPRPLSAQQVRDHWNAR